MAKEAVIVFGRKNGKGFVQAEDREVDRSAGSKAAEAAAKSAEGSKPAKSAAKSGAIQS
jgi:hypothetical protein